MSKESKKTADEAARELANKNRGKKGQRPVTDPEWARARQAAAAETASIIREVLDKRGEKP